MATTTDTYLLLRAFVDELARCGMRAACTSPGSRSAPLVLSLAREPRPALLLARRRALRRASSRSAWRRPRACRWRSPAPRAPPPRSCWPPAIEAREARVPLLLLTADRPAELRENGAGQAIDQLKLFGGAAKWFFEVERARRRPSRAAALDPHARLPRLLRRRSRAAPGAVHLNFPLREPLVDRRAAAARMTAAAPGGAPVRARAPAGAPRGRRATRRSSRELLAGAGAACSSPAATSAPTALGAAAAAASPRRAGWPLLADPLSGARRGDGGDRPLRRAAARRALRRPRLRPDLVLRVGDLPGLQAAARLAGGPAAT